MALQLEFKLGADEREMVTKVKRGVAQINEAREHLRRQLDVERQIATQRQELARLATQQRQATFDALPLEERLNQLYAKRATLQAMAARHTGSDNERLKNAITLAQARNDAALKPLEAERAAGAAAAAAQQAAAAARVQSFIAANHQKTAALARDERRQKFESLPVTERLALLEAQRAKTAERLARSAGNTRRTSALQLRQAQLDAQLRALRPPSLDLGSAGRNFLADAAGRVPLLGGQLRTALLSVNGALTRALAAATGFGAALTAIVWPTVKAVRFAQSITDLAARTQLSFRSLQGWGIAAEATGTQLDAVVNVIETVRRAQGEALAGNEKFLKYFTRLGITTQDLARLAPDELFTRIAAPLKTGASSSAEYAAAIKLLGDQAKEMLPAIQKGLADHAAAFAQSNLAIRDGTVENLANLGDAWDRHWATVKAGGKKTMGELAGGVVTLSQLYWGLKTSLMGAVTGNAPLKEWGMDQLTKRFLALSGGSGAEGVKALEAKFATSNEAKEQSEKTAAAEAEAAQSRKLDQHQRLLTLQEREAQLQKSLLSDEERRAQLLADIARTQQLIDVLTAEDAAGLQAEITEQRIRLLELQKELPAAPAEPAARARVAAPAVDALQRIGGLSTRPAADLREATALARQQLAALRAIHTRLNQPLRTDLT